MTSEEYYELNQRNAKANPVATAPRTVDDAYKSEYRQKYGRDYAADTHALTTDASRLNREVEFWRKVTKAGVTAGWASGMPGAFSSGGAGAASGVGAAGSGTGAGGAVLPSTSAGFSTIGSLAVPAGGNMAATTGGTIAGGIPWGRVGQAANAVLDVIGAAKNDNPHQSALQRTLGDRPPAPSPITPPSAVSAITGGNSGVVTPKAVTATVAPVQGPPPAGFDAKNWADPNMHSVKYDAGRLLSGATKPSEVARIVGSPQFQARFPGATFDGKDRIDFKGALSDGDRGGTPVGVIDVLMSADQGSDTSNGFWWGFEPDGGMGVTSNPIGGGLSALMPGGQSDFLAEILATLQAQTQAADPQALLLDQLR